jgi:hypothetical protein
MVFNRLGEGPAHRASNLITYAGQYWTMTVVPIGLQFQRNAIGL